MTEARPGRAIHDLAVAILSVLAIAAVVAAGLWWLSARG